MQFSIIPIAEGHIEGFWAAVDKVARERRYIGFLEGPPIEQTRAFVRENIEANRPHFVAVHTSGVIGWCDISPLNRPIFSHSGVLGMGVLSEFRGQGVGKALITAVIDKAKSLGLTRIELTVRQDNYPAIALYEKVGFEREAIKRNAVRVDGVYYNDLGMALLLPQ